MATFFIISGVLFWIIILLIIISIAYEYYDQYLIKKAFKRVEKRRLDLLFKDAQMFVVNKELNSNRGVIIKEGETVKSVPHDRSKREYRVLTFDYRFIEGVKPEFLDSLPRAFP